MPSGRRSAHLKALLDVVTNPSAYPPEAVTKAVAGIAQIEVSRQSLFETREKGRQRKRKDAAAAERQAAKETKNFVL
jgi:hypothetical protein